MSKLGYSQLGTIRFKNSCFALCQLLEFSKLMGEASGKSLLFRHPLFKKLSSQLRKKG